MVRPNSQSLILMKINLVVRGKYFGAIKCNVFTLGSHNNGMCLGKTRLNMNTLVIVGEVKLAPV